MSEISSEKSAPCDCQSGPSSASRRSFLRTVVITAATLVILPSTLASADNVPITWIDLGTQPEPTTDWTQITLPASANNELIFIRKVIPQTDSGAAAPIYQAVSSRCSHRHCVVAFQASDVTFHCPCHGGIFDSNAYPTYGPPKSALPPLLVQWTPSSAHATTGRLLIEAPNPITTSPEG
jgi:Rieske Fe-S protein